MFVCIPYPVSYVCMSSYMYVLLYLCVTCVCTFECIIFECRLCLCGVCVWVLGEMFLTRTKVLGSPGMVKLGPWGNEVLTGLQAGLETRDHRARAGSAERSGQ